VLRLQQFETILARFSADKVGNSFDVHKPILFFLIGFCKVKVYLFIYRSVQINMENIDPTLLPPIDANPASDYTPVQPSAQIISYVEIECRVVLHKGMFCLVHTYDSNKQKIKVFSVELTPEEYETWISDVEMESLILSKCGLAKA
jgi:hypothetical protein